MANDSKVNDSKVKDSPQRRALVEGGTLGAGVLLALGLFGMLNYLAYRHYARFDWTSSKLYTLSEKSVNVAKGLDRDVEGIIFLSPDAELYPAVDELLSRYEAANPAHFKKRTIDPAKDMLAAKALVEQYDIDRSNVVVIASGDDKRVLDQYELAEYDYSGAQMGEPPKLAAFKGEQLITSAILELAEAKKPKIVFTTGHGESTFGGAGGRSLAQAKSYLGDDNFEISEWKSLGESAVPSGTDLVIVAGPTAVFLPPELEALTRYLDGGGRMLVLLDPVLDVQTAGDLGLGAFLAARGVEIRSDLVIDPAQQLPFFGPETIFTADYGSHPIVDPLQKTATPVLLSLARRVARAETVPSGTTVTELVKASRESWAELDLAALPQVEQGDGDTKGPVSLGVAVSFKVGPEPAAPATDAGADDAADEEAGDGGTKADDTRPEARLVVFGDVDFVSDNQIGNGANGSLFLDTLNWLVQRDQLVAIEARRPEQTRLTLAKPELQVLYAIVMGLLPGLAIVAGITVYFRRRR